MFLEIKDCLATNKQVRPSSDAVLHMSLIEFDELSSCEVQRLNQFGTVY